MPNRPPKFLSTIVAGCLAGAALTGASHGATPAPPPAADTCLSAPKDPAPSGSHWYYRIERSTKRHCWYIGAQHDVRVQTAPSNVASTAPPAAQAAPKAEAAMPGTVVNAHAELAARGAQEASAASQVPSAAPAGAASIGNSATASAVDADAQRSLIATRWPDQAAADEPDVTDATTDNSGASQQKSAAPATPPAASPVTAAPLAAADASSAKQSGSIRTLLIVIAGALALAGLVGGAIVRFGGGRWFERREIEEDDRSELWDAVRADHRSRPVFPEPPVEPRLPARFPGDLRAAGASRAANAPAAATALRAANAPRAASIPRLASAARAANDPDDKIAEMLARLARSAQS
jgi:hypothetical protein